MTQNTLKNVSKCALALAIAACINLSASNAFSAAIGLNAFSGSETVIDFEDPGSGQFDFADPLNEGTSSTVTISRPDPGNGSLGRFGLSSSDPEYMERVNNTTPKVATASTKTNSTSNQIIIDFDQTRDVGRVGVYLSSTYSSTGGFTSVPYTLTAENGEGVQVASTTGTTTSDPDLDDPDAPEGDALAIGVDDGQFAGIQLDPSDQGPIETFTIEFSNSLGGGTSLVFDDVRFESIPEPAALALVGVGGLIMLARRR